MKRGKYTKSLAKIWAEGKIRIRDIRGNVLPKFLELCRAVIKSRGPGISPGYYECGPRLLLLENRRKIEPKEIPCCLIPLLLVVFTRQLEILVTTLAL